MGQSTGRGGEFIPVKDDVSTLPTVSNRLKGQRLKVMTFMYHCLDRKQNRCVVAASWVATDAFRCSAPATWNSLPRTVTDNDSVTRNI